jgi:hypothetical protein
MNECKWVFRKKPRPSAGLLGGYAERRPAFTGLLKKKKRAAVR